MEPCTKALSVEAHNGHVLIEGEGGTAVTLSPHAAMDTSDELATAAAEASGQAQMKALGARPLDSW